MKYKLLQIKDFKNNNYMFMNYDWAKEKGFKLEDYEVVYEGEYFEVANDVIVLIILEDLFYTFNVNRPKDFRGHSMSVSDVIYLDGKYYYTDSIGFKEVN